MRLIPPSPVCNDAEFSNAGLERLWLSRKVGDVGPVGLIIGLNPSTAGATDTDPTITKECEYARRWGWSGFWKGNLFTCVETYSAKLTNLRLDTAVGEHGDAALERMIPEAPAIVVCWGSSIPKDKRSRIQVVSGMIRALKHPAAPVLCLGVTRTGDPLHTSRLAYDTPLAHFELPEQVSRR